jgi:spore germination cell wall hydrolase CwlJ-like protein
MGCSRIGWAAGVFAPWCLGVALAVSISADAGQETASGASLAPLPLRAPAPPAVLVPAEPSAQPSELAIDFGGLSGEAGKILREASLSIGGDEDFRRLPDEIEPRADLKRNAHLFPSIDRTHKGDPLVGLRPAFDSRLRDPHGLAKLRAEDLLFHHDENLPAAGFVVPNVEASPSGSVTAFEPWPDGDSPTTAHSSAGASPGQNGSPVTMRPAAINERLMQGATPAIRRAIGLGSTTPAPADSTPVEVVALPGEPRGATPTMGEAPAAGARPNYAALLDQDKAARENRCLAEAIYFEARGESDEGQAAVAQVVLNRVASGLYPATICGVVYQNRQRWHGCQFSFACEGKSPRITEPDAWRRALQIAAEVTNGKTYVSDIAGSTHYHANYVRPRWARRLEKMDVIGHHIFYKLRPGQS